MDCFEFDFWRTLEQDNELLRLWETDSEENKLDLSSSKSFKRFKEKYI